MLRKQCKGAKGATQSCGAGLLDMYSQEEDDVDPGEEESMLGHSVVDRLG